MSAKNGPKSLENIKQYMTGMNEAMKCLEDLTERLRKQGMKGPKAFLTAAKMMDLELDLSADDFVSESEPTKAPAKLHSAA